MNAVRAEHADDNRADTTDYVSRVWERLGHRENSRAETSFQQVKKGFRIAVELMNY